MSLKPRKTSPSLCAERVLGSSFGDALKLDPDNFDLHFDLGETSILTHIINILAPDAPDLRCELCQLNMYASLAPLSSRDWLVLWLSLCKCHASPLCSCVCHT